MNKLCLYIKRVITRTGPHGKNCGCNKWGHYIGLGCSHPTHKIECGGYVGIGTSPPPYLMDLTENYFPDGQIGTIDINHDPNENLIIQQGDYKIGMETPKEKLNLYDK